MSPKPNLGRIIRKQRAEGTLQPHFGAYVPGSVAPASHDAEAILDFIEANLTDDAPLMAREWVTLALTDIIKSVKTLDTVGPRCDAIAARLSAIKVMRASMREACGGGEGGEGGLEAVAESRPGSSPTRQRQTSHAVSGRIVSSGL